MPHEMFLRREDAEKGEARRRYRLEKDTEAQGREHARRRGEAREKQREKKRERERERRGRTARINGWDA